MALLLEMATKHGAVAFDAVRKGCVASDTGAALLDSFASYFRESIGLGALALAEEPPMSAARQAIAQRMNELNAAPPAAGRGGAQGAPGKRLSVQPRPSVNRGMSSLQVLHISHCMSSLQILCSYGILVMAY